MNKIEQMAKSPVKMKLFMMKQLPMAFFAANNGPGQDVPRASTDLSTVKAVNSSCVMMIFFDEIF